MVKTKNKKVTSDSVNLKKTMKTKKIMNPFEIHVNKEKMRVLGKKSKNDRGLPGIARAKAITKRKHTLLKEYNSLHKSNLISDKRIGEKNTNMSSDERTIARFAAERMKAHKKKSIFNLADDEVLTHKGQVLTEIEKFDDPRSSDDESDHERDNSGKLDQNFTEQAHFGGGMLQQTGMDGITSHRELIDKLIAESKKRKAEKQKLKEATIELTETLDSEWKDLLPLMKSKSKDTDQKRPIDNYDKMMRQLIFEARGQPADRLKTEDEVAKEEKDRLEKLEQERLERMRGKEQVKTVKYRSADDLDDNFAYDSDPDVTLSYDQEGKANIDISNGEKAADDNDDTQNEKLSEGSESDDNGSEDESEDDLSDLKASESEDEEIEENEVKEPNSTDFGTEKKKDVENSNTKRGSDTSVELVAKKTADSNMEVERNCEETEQERENELAKEKARNELPYTFKLPESYEELQKLLDGHSSCNQSVIIERMIKCNHPSLGEANKDKLGVLFVYLLQHFNDIASVKSTNEISKCFETFKQLLPNLFSLTHLIQKSAHDSLVEIIKEKHQEYRKNHKKQPDISTLLFLKLVSTVFTTSDFRHQVATPSLLLMEQILTKCLIKSRNQISYGLFVSTLVLEYTSLSKRYLPAVINYLTSLLYCAIPKNDRTELTKVMKPFNKNVDYLVLNTSFANKKSHLKLNCTDLVDKNIDDDFKVTALHVCIKLLEEFSRNLEYLPSSCEIFKNALGNLKKIPISLYPKTLQEDLRKMIEYLDQSGKNKRLKHLLQEKKKPKALRLYEPSVEKIYDHKKHREKSEMSKLRYKLKQEKKGVLREIRRDAAFLGRVKLKERIQSDIQRKQKVNRIMAEANMQQSELNELDRKKKRK